MGDDFIFAKVLRDVHSAVHELAKWCTRIEKISELYPEKFDNSDFQHAVALLSQLKGVLAPASMTEDPHGGAVPLFRRRYYSNLSDNAATALRQIWESIPVIHKRVFALVDHKDSQDCRVLLATSIGKIEDANLKLRRELLRLDHPKDETEVQTDDVRANALKLFPGGMPENQDIIDLVVKLNTEKDSGKSMNAIALEFAGEKKKAQSLLSQIRRMRRDGKVDF